LRRRAQFWPFSSAAFRSDRRSMGGIRVEPLVRRVLDDPVFGSKDATHELVESRWTTS